MVACRSQLHQSVLAVPGVQCEGLPYEDGRRCRTEADTYPLADADHVEDDEEDEERQQPTRKDEEVLRLQTLELNRTADTLVDGVFSHCMFRLVTPYYILKEERAQDGGCHDEEDTRSEPACGGLGGVGVARRELAIDLHAADESDHCADGVDEFRAGIEIRGDHGGGFVDACQSVALCECGCACSDEECCREDCSDTVVLVHIDVLFCALEGWIVLVGRVDNDLLYSDIVVSPFCFYGLRLSVCGLAVPCTAVLLCYHITICSFFLIYIVIHSPGC